jgi:cytochrome c5
MSKSILLGFSAACFLLLACKTTAPVSGNTANDQATVSNSKPEIKPEWLDMAKEMDGSATMDHLLTGKKIYQETCTKCHGFKDAKKYDAVAWERVLQAMIPRAKLTPDEAHHLRLYTLVYQKN